jgi:6-pyruvoyltetrahydropterin/6-carboxytetrahydropterin synthase
MPIHLERTYRFSAAHLYTRPEWSSEENRARFGRCAIPPGHGHNYRLTVTIAGPVDAATGFVVDLAELDELVRVRVLDRLDHQHLNYALKEFGAGGLVPTSENLALWIRDQITGALPAGALLAAIRLAEDDDLAATWTATAIEQGGASA